MSQADSSASQTPAMHTPPQLARTATYLVGSTPGFQPEEDDMMTEQPQDISINQQDVKTISKDKLVSFKPTGMYGGSRKGAKTFQEDSYFHFSSANNRVLIGGVLDGHGGYNGMLASQTARDTATQFFHAHSENMEGWENEHWQETLHELFLAMHDAIRQKFIAVASEGSAGEQRYVDEKGIVRSTTNDPIHGGSTCTILVLIKHPDMRSATIITANVGDSTSLLLTLLADAKTHQAYEFLSTDHGPENADEYMRIKNMNLSTRLLLVYDKTSVMRKYECPSVFNDDGQRDQALVANPWGHGLHPTNVRYEPAVYAVTPRSVSKDSTCIAMTRALGDFYAHQFGLTAVPDIHTRTMSLDESAATSFTLIVASDGIWDCWCYPDFAEFVAEQLSNKRYSLNQAGDAVLDESINRAIHNFGSKHYDDAALVMWKFP